MVVRADSNGDQQALWVKIEALRAQGLRVIEGSIEYLDHEQEHDQHIQHDRYYHCLLISVVIKLIIFF